MAVRYNPADHAKVVLVETNMPRGGPRTAENMRILEVCAGSFLVLLAIARVHTAAIPLTKWILINAAGPIGSRVSVES